MRRRAILVLLMLLAAASPAGAGIYSRVLRAYEDRGSVPACEFSSPQLERALKGIDTYGAQYFQDFTAAVQTALAARASGACAPAQTQRVATGAPSGGAGPALKLPAVGAASDASLPAPIVLMAALAALLAAIGAVGTLIWWRGWSPRWAPAWRHAWREAGYRAGGSWDEFADWLRSGSDQRT